MHIEYTNPSTEYFHRKMQLLNDCLNLSEQLLSCLEDWESLETILTKRSVIINKIQLLDEMYPQEIIDACSGEQKLEAHQLLSLILNLNRDAEKLLREEKERIVASIKSNVQGQKVARYGSPGTETGHLIDHKK